MATVSRSIYWSRFFGPMGRGVILAFVILLNGVVGAAPRDDALNTYAQTMAASAQHSEQCSRQGGTQLPHAPRCHHLHCCVVCVDGDVSIDRTFFGVATLALDFDREGVAPAATQAPAPKSFFGLLTTGSPRSPPAVA